VQQNVSTGQSNIANELGGEDMEIQIINVHI